MYTQPLMCVAAANRIIRKRQELERPCFVIVDGHENELQVIQNLLYICKKLWLQNHTTCEMIPENFQITWEGPKIMGLRNYFPGYTWQKRWPKYYLETRQLTQEECELIDQVVKVYNRVHSQRALFEYTRRGNGLLKQTQRAGLHVITTDMIKLYISNSKNQQELELFALWGLNPKWKELARWGSKKIIL